MSMYDHELQHPWRDAVVVMIGTGFLIFELYWNLRDLWRKLWEKLKQHPKTIIRGRLAQELDAVLRSMGE